MQFLRCCLFTRVIPDKLPFSFDQIKPVSSAVENIESVNKRINHLKHVLNLTAHSSQSTATIHLSSILSNGTGSNALKHAGKATILGSILTMGQYFLQHSQDFNGKKANIYFGVGFALAIIGLVVDILIRNLRSEWNKQIAENRGFATVSGNQVKSLEAIQDILDTVRNLFDSDSEIRNDANAQAVASLNALVKKLKNADDATVSNNLALAIGELRRYYLSKPVPTDQKSDVDDSHSEDKDDDQMVNLERSSDQPFSAHEIVQINKIVKDKIVQTSVEKVNEISKWTAVNVPKEILMKLDSITVV